MMKKALFAAVFSAIAGAAVAAPVSYSVDPTHTVAQYDVRHLGFSVQSGVFTKAAGTVVLDTEAKKGAVDITIDTNSLQTYLAARDNHLKSKDFFNVAQFPTITFKSTKVEANGSDSAKITGDLTIKGVTKSVVLEAEFLGETKSPFGDVRAGFTATTKINREDFGLTWNMALETGGWLVGKDISITLDVEAIKA